jgi:hypothetical protein
MNKYFINKGDCMLIEYRREHPPTSRTWFAKITPKNQALLQAHLEQVLLDIAEASVQGTELDQKLWAAATFSNKEIWNRAQQHRNQANTLISVLAGSISKIRNGGDLTAKQLQHIKTVLDVLTLVRGDPVWDFQEVKEYSQTGNTLQDLQNRLFTNA